VLLFLAVVWDSVTAAGSDTGTGTGTGTDTGTGTGNDVVRIDMRNESRFNTAITRLIKTGTVGTGSQAQCQGTDAHLNSRPLGVGLELSVNGIPARIPSV
jgi:hypothetical protein